jgi:hypothetical protein
MRQTNVNIARYAALCISVTACNLDLNTTAIDIPLSPPVGSVRTREFVASSSVHAYEIFIGLGTISTDEATCLAVRPTTAVDGTKYVYPNHPCNALIPPLGSTQWIVTRAGVEVDRGGSAAAPWTWPREYEIGMAWYQLGRFRVEPGERYVVEIIVQPSEVPLDQVHPRLKIETPWK